MGDFSSLLVDDETFLDYWISGGIDVLTFLPEDITMRIIESLDMKNVCRLAQTSKKLRNLCDRDDIWLKLCFQNEIISEETYHRKKMEERYSTSKEPLIRHWKQIYLDFHHEEQNWKKGIASQDLLLNFSFNLMTMQIAAGSYLVVYGSVGNSHLAVLWDISTNAFISTLYDGDCNVRTVHVNGLYAIVVCHSFGRSFFRIVSLTFPDGIEPLDVDSVTDYTFHTPQIQFGLSGFFITQGVNIHYYSLGIDMGDYEEKGHILCAEELVLKSQSEPRILCSVTDSKILFSCHEDGKLRVWTNLNPSHPESYVCTVVDQLFDDISEIQYCNQADLVIISAYNGVFAINPHSLKIEYHIHPAIYTATLTLKPHIQFSDANMLLSTYDMVAVIHVKTGKVKYAFEFTAGYIGIRCNFLLTQGHTSIAIHDITNGKKVGAVSFPLGSQNRITHFCNTKDKIVIGASQGLFVWDFKGTPPDKRKLIEQLNKEENSALKKIKL